MLLYMYIYTISIGIEIEIEIPLSTWLVCLWAWEVKKHKKNRGYKELIVASVQKRVYAVEVK